MPGVPDVYQGTEIVDLSLVDPDNRRPVDYAYRERLLSAVESGSLQSVSAEERLDAEKLLVTRSALHLRRAHPEWFTQGSYTPVPTSSTHAVAFARDSSVVTVVTRLPLKLEELGGWGSAVVVLPEGKWTNVLTGEAITGGPLELATLLDRLPVALLTRA
jgi:(1->4)-alpha-D-glucan 1-alpha-D-glucosylmutase